MKETVQIIQFKRNPDRPTDYQLASIEPTGLNFDWFKVTPTRKPNILKLGAKRCLEYWNGHKMKHITGLFKIDMYHYYGDINEDTAAICVNSENGMIEISIIKGHRPKGRSIKMKLAARKKTVIQFFTKQKNKA